MNAYEWEGVKDSTQSLFGLIEGKNALISPKIYNEFKDVDSTVKTAISFIESNANWSFFAFRGDSKRSPKWLLFDVDEKPITDFTEISEKLKIFLSGKDIIQRRWNEVNTLKEIQEIVSRLRKQEKSLLPWKKKRALDKGEKILKEFFKAIPKNQLNRKRQIHDLLYLLDEKIESENMIDFNHFADLWLTILQPALDKKRQNQTRRRKIITINDLKLKDVEIDDEKLHWLYENCQYSYTLDELIASCIIAVKKNDQ